MSVRHPKYAFGLLQTPSDAEKTTSTSGDPTSKLSSTSSSNLMWPTKSITAERGLHTPAAATVPAVKGAGDSSSITLRTPLSRTPKSRTPRGTNTTPRTTTSTTSNDPSSTLVAIVEGRGHARGEIGMTSMDLKEPVLELSQFSDCQTYAKTLAKLQLISPLEILLPNTLIDSGSNCKLLSLISKQFPNIPTSSVQRRYFNEKIGLDFLKNLCANDYKSFELQIASKYYCLATTAALLKYVEFIQNMMFAPNSLRVVFKGCEHTTMIDSVTVKNLELLQNLKDPMSQHTLFGILNHTKTSGGARLLRSNILQPSNDEETILLRYDVLSELTEKEELFFNLQSVLSKFPDIGRIVSVCVQIPKRETAKTAESKLNCVIMLKHTLQLLEPLRELLSHSENYLMKVYWQALGDSRYETLLSIIGGVIREETHVQKGALQQRFQTCSAIKSKINGLLDVARRTYHELMNDVELYIQQLAENYSLPLRTSYSSLRGFYIQLNQSEAGAYSKQGGSTGSTVSQDNLPAIFIKVTKCKGTLSFTTMDLIQLNERIKTALDDIFNMANEIVTRLLGDIREHIGCLYQLSDIVSTLDMLVAFAHAATLSNYIRPEFTDTMAIKQGFHPILKRFGSEQIVPNDTFASEHSNFIILTGPNMGGKSTYLRQIALLQIMAQMGSFVPAQYASFRIADQIFSRIGSDDDMQSNSSTFTLEMRETNYILQNVTDASLIIIDELGRGTSAEEGVGMCWAISESLMKMKAFTFFATHYRQLTDMDRNYPNVSNYFFEIQKFFNPESKCEKISYTHVLSRGVTPEIHYGLQLASMSSMPVSVIEDAKKIAVKIEKEKRKNQTKDKNLLIQHARYRLATKLIQVAKNSKMDADSLRIYISSLRRTYEADMAKAAKSVSTSSSDGMMSEQ